jgi:hypothetical protein
LPSSASGAGLVLLELVRESESSRAKSFERRGLGYALARICTGHATGLVVADLTRLSGSMSELGHVLDWFCRADARLVAVAQGLDTAETDGRLAAQTLIELSGWECERLGERAAPCHQEGESARGSMRKRGDASMPGAAGAKLAQVARFQRNRSAGRPSKNGGVR